MINYFANAASWSALLKTSSLNYARALPRSVGQRRQLKPDANAPARFEIQCRDDHKNFVALPCKKKSESILPAQLFR